MLAYKSSLFNAFHRRHVVSNISTAIYLLTYIIQIFGLLLFENYYVYLVFRPISIVLINVITALYSKRDYPEYKCYGNIENEELATIKNQVKGLLCQRLAFKSRNAFDSLVISSLFGLTIVGMYSNYFYIIGSIDLVLELIFRSMQSGIGNSVACESAKKNYLDFNKINFLYMWISGICTVCFIVLCQDFMSIWVGGDLLFPFE